MTATIGSYSLSFAVLAAAGAMVAAFGAAISRDKLPFLRLARWSIAAHALLLTIASALLTVAFVNSDFRLHYVANYTEKALPLGYKLAAFWAGQEGSLLLWAWLLAAMAVVFAISKRREQSTEHSVALMALAAVCGFFAVLMILVDVANPFRPNPAPGIDGHGLNPMLQNVAMLAHPPTLFIGYAAFTIPFAMMIGALAAGDRQQQWVAGARRWTLFAWVFLSVGILLGSWWAYLELGWGGYWAWDPVENASLFPWLTGTAMLHLIMVQQQRNMFRVWNPVMAAVTFLLCIFGTYLTRSGVMSTTSVHSFPKSELGVFLLLFLGLCTAVTVALILYRRQMLRDPKPLESLVSREGAVLAGSALLVAMMVLTLLGTTFPIYAPVLKAIVPDLKVFAKLRAILSAGVVTQDFYNRAVLPLGLLLAALMAIAPVLGYGRGDRARLWRDIMIPGVLALLVAAVLAAAGVYGMWASSCALVVTFTLAAIVVDYVRSVVARVKVHGQNALAAAITLIDGNHRRYGGHLVHVGMALMIVGIAGSSLYKAEEKVSLVIGQSAQVGQYTLEYKQLENLRESNYHGVQALLVATDGTGQRAELRPEIRIYDKYDSQRSVEVALLWGLRQDLYVSMAGLDADGSHAAFQVMVEPLVTWIWIGSAILTLGGLFCLMPRLLPAREEAQVAEAAPVAAVAMKADKRASKAQRAVEAA